MDLKEEMNFKFKIYGMEPPEYGEPFPVAVKKILALIEKLESGLDGRWVEDNCTIYGNINGEG